MSAVTAGVKDVREVVERARARLGEHGQGTILFLDEVHRFNRTQQDALLPHVEDGLLVLVGATTENPFFSLTGPLLSRSTLFRLEPLEPDDLARCSTRALTDSRARPRRDEPLASTPTRSTHLADRSRRRRPPRAHRRSRSPRALAAEAGRNEITLADAEAALGAARAALRRRRALRRAVRVHQEHPRLRSGRRAVLARADARGGRGPAPHRPPPGDPRVGGRRHGRSAGVARRRCRGTRGRVRRAARGAAQPRPGRDPPGARAEVERGDRAASAPRSRTCATSRRARSLRICGTLITLAPRSSATGRGTAIRTTSPRDGCSRSTGPEVAGHRYYRPSDAG